MMHEGLKSVIKSSNGRIIITCFASNVARIKSIIEASIENNKKVFIVGRSLNRAIEAANEVGYRVEGIEKSFKNLENLIMTMQLLLLVDHKVRLDQQ